MALESIRQKNIYRGPSSSAEFNKRNAAILKDIHTLYEKLNENEESIEESMDIVLRENFFLQNHVSLLRQEIEKLRRLGEEKEEYASDADTARNIFVQNFYQTNAFRNGTGTQEARLTGNMGSFSQRWPTALRSSAILQTTGKSFSLPDYSCS